MGQARERPQGPALCHNCCQVSRAFTAASAGREGVGTGQRLPASLSRLPAPYNRLDTVFHPKVFPPRENPLFFPAVS